MAIKWDAYKSSLTEGNGKGKYYARVVQRPVYDYELLKKQIERQCSATEEDVTLIVDSIAGILKKALSQGESVKIDGLGTFELQIGALGADSYDALSNKDIRVKGIRFLPDNRLLEYVKNCKVPLERVKRNEPEVWTDDSVKIYLKRWFKDHEVITCAELCAKTTMSRTACNEVLKRLCKGDEALLRNIASSHFPVYALNSK